MRGPAARRGRGRVVGHRVAGRGLAVGNDKGRGVVEVAVIQPGAGELLNVEPVRRLAHGAPRRLSGGRVVLDLGRHARALLDRALGVAHGEARDLLGDRQPLRLVGVEDGRRRPALQVRGEHPREVHGVRDPRVHAVAGVGHPDVGRVAAQEDPPLAQLVHDQPPADPVLVAEDLVREALLHAEQEAETGVAVDRLEVGLVGQEVVVHEPGLPPVDGDEVARALGGVEVAHPLRLPPDPAEQPRRAEVGRLDALNDGVALKRRADLSTDGRASAVAAHEVLRTDRERLPRLEVARRRPGALGVLTDALDLGAVEDGHARRRRGAGEQHRLEEDLVDAVGRLRRRPPAVGPARIRVAVAPAGNVDAHELIARRARAHCDVVGKVPRQASRAHLVREAEPAEDLHRARGDVVALDARRLAGPPPLGDEHKDAALGQVDGERQPHGAAADDGDLGGEVSGHARAPCAPRDR